MDTHEVVCWLTKEARQWSRHAVVCYSSKLASYVVALPANFLNGGVFPSEVFIRAAFLIKTGGRNIRFIELTKYQRWRGIMGLRVLLDF